MKIWFSKKTSVSHGSTESDIFFSLVTGLRIDGLPALDLWDIVIDVLRLTKGNADSNVHSSRRTGARPKTTQDDHNRKKSYHEKCCKDTQSGLILAYHEKCFKDTQSGLILVV